MRIIIGTNRYRDFCAGVTEATERFRAASRIYLPFVALAELRAGFLCGTRTTKNEMALARFVTRPRVRVLLPDEETTHHYARVFSHLRRQGTPIPTNDMWIAALAIQHNLLLFSRDGHYDHLPQLPRAD